MTGRPGTEDYEVDDDHEGHATSSHGHRIQSQAGTCRD